MLRKSTTILVIVLYLSVFAILSSTKANAASVAKNPPATSCSVLEVIPHGSLPATYQCIKKNTSNTTIESPNTGLCGDSLNLFWDANGQGSDLCFTLAGTYDMTDFFDVPHNHSWNDEASSYRTTCSLVTFYTDIQEEGSSVTVGTNSGITNFGPGAVPNDTLSSLVIFATC